MYQVVDPGRKNVNTLGGKLEWLIPVNLCWTFSKLASDPVPDQRRYGCAVQVVCFEDIGHDARLRKNRNTEQTRSGCRRHVVVQGQPTRGLVVVNLQGAGLASSHDNRS